MKIYLLTQNAVRGYDTYDSSIVIANSHKEAKEYHPNGDDKLKDKENNYYGEWAKFSKDVKSEEIGEANENQKEGVLISSFNAG